jgi:2-phospho-L-lactate/phosphoenolpyruvate guanylyltransferase
MRRDAVPAASPVGVVIPLRSFRDAKVRLAAALDPETRAEIARRMADTVVEAAGSMPVVVVSSASEVHDWALARGLVVIEDPGGLDQAADAGRDHHRGAGRTRVVIAHADLPRARSLAPLARDLSRPVAAFVPCHRDDGTNVLSIPADVPFRFAYGPGSFRRHTAEARRLGLGVRVIRIADLAVDVDSPDDLVYVELPCALP